MTTFKIVFTFDVFFSAEFVKPQCTAKWPVFYITWETGTFQSALLFTNTISDPMTVTWQEEPVSERQADDIVRFYIALLDFFPATL